MGCIYDYKGHVFQSELELDDFLLERGHLISKYGDIVFSKSNRAIQTYDSIMSLKMDTEALKASRTISEVEDGKNDIENINVSGNGYIGVNKFLQGLRNLDGNLLFPEFKPENYWKEIKPRWAGGNFDKEEAAAIFGENMETRPIVSDEEFARAREVIENKWKVQGKIGTELHKVMQKYFSESKSGRNIRESDDNFLINTYFPSVLDTSLVPSKVITEAVKYCRDLEKSLQKELGEDLIYLPEVAVSGGTSQINESGNPSKLLGVIDLLVIDKRGNAHIIDYKTSPRPYIGTASEAGYDSAKILTFKYQLGVYERLLRKYGINTSGSKLFIAPIQLSDFRREGDDWVYSGINEYSGHVEDLTQDIKTNINIQENIDEFLPAPFITKATTENLLQTVTSVMSKWFPRYDSVPGEITDDMVTETIKEGKGDKPNPETGKYVYSPKGNGYPIKADTYEELFVMVKRRMNSIANNKINSTQVIKEGLIKAIEDENPYYEFTKAQIPDNPRGVNGWFQRRMARYCNSNWEVVDCEPAEYLGCILLRNKFTNQIDVVKISTSMLKRSRELIKGRHGLTGAFESDIISQNKPNSLMMESVNGNIELMEAMLVLNNLPSLFEENAIVGEVSVYNPFREEGISADNRQLLYCFNELDKLSPIGVNNMKGRDAAVKMANRYDIFYNRFREIISSVKDDTKVNKKWRKFAESTSVLDACIGDPTQLRLELLNLRKEFLEAFPNVNDTRPNDDVIGMPHVQVYRMLEMAIGEIDGLDFRQQLSDHDKWLESIYVWKAGMEGTYLDNPGNMKSPILNKLTSLVTIAYQNIRDTVNRSQGEIRTLVNELKNDQGFTYLKERTIGNQATLYRDMIVYTDDGDILLKNPDDPTTGLSEAQRKFLRYFLKTVNSNRFKNMTEEELEEMRLSGDVRYYRLPLSAGNATSIASSKGLLSAIKDKLQDWNLKKAVERARTKVEGFLDPTDVKVEKIRKGELWEMTNSFDIGEKGSDIRLSLIEDRKPEFFETNLETLLLKHITAYSAKEHLDEIFPSLQALAIHLSDMGTILNDKFEDDLKYLSDYVRNKIFNQSLISDDRKPLAAITGGLMGFASKIALAFSPVQMYQHLDGIWKDISLVIRKPDGGLAFTKENMVKAYKHAIADAVHYGNNKSMSELLNEQYGLNDMDMNTYADKVKSDQAGIWNFWSAAFRFASRPDFYNRMTIFGAQMRGDGCWEAHSVHNGKLVYDWKKDKRFDAYANGNTASPDYKKQEALYYTMAHQLVKEHTRNEDGSLFRVGDALPKAYTVQQSESHKALADSIYGYYSHEKKSMFQSTLIGGLFFQMCTYWSSKKNQYLAPEGIKLQGRLVHYEENGQKYYHKLDDKGQLTDEATTEDTGFPFYKWEGRFEEGILLTFTKVLNDLVVGSYKKGSVREGWKLMTNDIWNNEDENLRRAYRSNLRQLFYDLFMLLFVGAVVSGSLAEFVKDDIKERGNDTMNDAVINTTLSLGSKILTNSAYDFNFLDAIAGRGTQWTPFSFETLNRTVDTFSSVISGDKSLYQGLINTVAATRATKPFWDYVDPTKEE